MSAYPYAPVPPCEPGVDASSAAYVRAATACASSAWNPAGWPCQPELPMVPQYAGDSEGTTPRRYCSIGSTLTVRATPSAWAAAMLPRRYTLPAAMHSWRACARVSCSGGTEGVAVACGPGPDAELSVAVPICVQGPAHPGPWKIAHVSGVDVRRMRTP